MYDKGYVAYENEINDKSIKKSYVNLKVEKYFNTVLYSLWR